MRGATHSSLPRPRRILLACRQVDSTFRRVFLHYSNLEVVETFDAGEKKWEDNVAQVSVLSSAHSVHTVGRRWPGLRGSTEIRPMCRCDWRAMHATLTSLALYFGRRY